MKKQKKDTVDTLKLNSKDVGSSAAQIGFLTNKIDSIISKNSKNVELRMLRYSIQKKSPFLHILREFCHAPIKVNRYNFTHFIYMNFNIFLYT